MRCCLHLVNYPTIVTHIFDSNVLHLHISQQGEGKTDEENNNEDKKDQGKNDEQEERRTTRMMRDMRRGGQQRGQGGHER